MTERCSVNVIEPSFEQPHSFNPGTPGYNALLNSELSHNEGAVSFSPNANYERYLRMHKVLVGLRGSDQLLEMHESLTDEYMPRYLSVAGWAAAEAAIVRTHDPEDKRLELIDKANDCWRRAIAQQHSMNGMTAPYLHEYAFPHRAAVDIAITPLLKGIIRGDIDSSAPREVFNDCISIAKKNAKDLHEAAATGNVEALSEHIGLGYELNALLAFNRRFSQMWFVMPGMNRSDSGYYYPQQTHDLMVVHQKWGKVLDVAPVEIKSAASARDRLRYKALLVRGKMHLSVAGKYRPEETLEAIVASHEGVATRAELALADDITARFIAMARDYFAGRKLIELTTKKSAMSFRDNSIVVNKYPGLLVKTAG